METRNYLNEICQELIGKWTTPQPPRPPSEWEIWREQVLTAFGKACVLVSDTAPRAHGQVLPFLPDGVRCPSACQLQTMGGVSAVYLRISRGNLGIEDQLGVWTPGLFYGLRLAGALRRYRGWSWAIWEVGRSELVADLADMPFPHKLEPRLRPDAMRRLRRCPVSHLGCVDPQDKSVVAGLFAGAVIKTIRNERWLVLPGDAQVKALLDSWTIKYDDAGLFRGEPRIKVSPFYAALVTHAMPPKSAGRILNLRRAGMCPLLPLVYWELAFAGKGRRYLPHADALPFGISRRTFHRLRYKRRDLHRTAVCEMRIVRPDRRLRELLDKWLEEHSGERSTIAKDSDVQTAQTAPVLQVAETTK